MYISICYHFPDVLLFSITGNLTQRHREIFYKNPLFVGMRLPEVRETEPLEKKFPRLSPLALDLMKVNPSLYLVGGQVVRAVSSAPAPSWDEDVIQPQNLYYLMLVLGVALEFVCCCSCHSQ